MNSKTANKFGHSLTLKDYDALIYFTSYFTYLVNLETIIKIIDENFISLSPNCLKMPYVNKNVDKKKFVPNAKGPLDNKGIKNFLCI